jgi:hypothetical protein
MPIKGFHQGARAEELKRAADNFIRSSPTGIKYAFRPLVHNGPTAFDGAADV